MPLSIKRSKRIRSIESITTSVRRPCRTSSPFALPTRLSSRSGTAALITRRRGVCATCFRTICCSCWHWIAMEPPVRYDRQSVRDRKADVLRAIFPIRLEQLDQVAVRGQYGPGQVDGVGAPGYRGEPNVAPDSGTETFAALKLTM